MKFPSVHCVNFQKNPSPYFELRLNLKLTLIAMMLINQILHRMFTSLYQDANSDPFRMNNDKAKFGKIAKYICPWRTNKALPSQEELKLTMSDNFSDHNIGANTLFVKNASGEPILKLCVGRKKYTKDPSSVDFLLWGHSYFTLKMWKKAFEILQSLIGTVCYLP